jgi:hypothetical protein
MATLNLTFPSPINISCKVGDTAYFVNNVSTLGGFQVGGNIELIGTINTITESGSNTIINVEVEGSNANVDTVTTTSFIMFSKDNEVEMSAIAGYYAQATFKNNSKEKAELYAVSCEIEQSSE